MTGRNAYDTATSGQVQADLAAQRELGLQFLETGGELARPVQVNRERGLRRVALHPTGAQRHMAPLELLAHPVLDG